MDPRTGDGYTITLASAALGIAVVQLKLILTIGVREEENPRVLGELGELDRALRGLGLVRASAVVLTSSEVAVAVVTIAKPERSTVDTDLEVGGNITKTKTHCECDLEMGGGCG